jgi:hypothetical protein
MLLPAHGRDHFQQYLPGEFVMKTLITAMAVTAILATSAVAKTQRTKQARNQPNNSVTQVNNAFCHFNHAHADPDPRIRFMLLRDCRNNEMTSPN